jgi:hypothetical protein
VASSGLAAIEVAVSYWKRAEPAIVVGEDRPSTRVLQVRGISGHVHDIHRAVAENLISDVDTVLGLRVRGPRDVHTSILRSRQLTSQGWSLRPLREHERGR